MAPAFFAPMRRLALRTVTAVLIAVTGVGPAVAQPAPPSERLARIAQSYADRGLFSGSVLVARDGEGLLSRGTWAWTIR